MSPLFDIRPFIHATVDLIFPPICIGCSDRLPSETQLALCQPCRRMLPIASGDIVLRRFEKLDDPNPFTSCNALWIFDDGGILQRLQHALKYGAQPDLGLLLGRELGNFLHPLLAHIPDAVVPIPLARSRYLERGYNQAERLAAGIAERMDIPVFDCLERTRSTRSQTSLSKTKRRTNVSGAFGLKSKDATIAGLHVILVDDILTTGATTLAAARPLLEAGARVDLAVLAVTAD